MTRTDEMVAWLCACLDEDERAARQAAEMARSTRWFSGAEGSVFGVDAGSGLHVRGAVLSLDDIGEHIASWDPARALAEVDAKRRILEEYEQAERRVHEDEQGPEGAEWNLGRRWAAWQMVRVLAIPYASRPGFRDEWRMTP